MNVRWLRLVLELGHAPELSDTRHGAEQRGVLRRGRRTRPSVNTTERSGSMPVCEGERCEGRWSGRGGSAGSWSTVIECRSTINAEERDLQTPAWRRNCREPMPVVAQVLPSGRLDAREDPHRCRGAARGCGSPGIGTSVHSSLRISVGSSRRRPPAPARPATTVAAVTSAASSAHVRREGHRGTQDEHRRSTWIVRTATQTPRGSRRSVRRPPRSRLRQHQDLQPCIRRPSARRVTYSLRRSRSAEDEDRDGRDARQRRERGPRPTRPLSSAPSARPVLVEGRLGRVDVDRAVRACLRLQRRPLRPGKSGMTVVGCFGEKKKPIRRSLGGLLVPLRSTTRFAPSGGARGTP